MKLPFWNRRRQDEDLDEEIRGHLNMAARDSTPQHAHREFGNVGQVKELTRSMWAGASIDRLGQEARFAIRSLRRAPGFSATSILILALAIGMASAMFTVFQQVVVKKLPVEDQGRVIEISGTPPGATTELGLFPKQLFAFREWQRTFQGVAGFAHWGSVPVPVTEGERQLLLRQATVTGNFFQVLGAAPVLGRLIRQEDEQTRDANDSITLAAVLSYDTWRRSFGGDSTVIGRRIRLPEIKWSAAIVGVAPPGLDYPRGTEIWTPNVRSTLDLVARLAPGATIDAARADYLAFVKQEPDYVRAGIANRIGVRAFPLYEMVVGNLRPALFALVAAVGVLLLLACVNVGNLLLLRAAGRNREYALRQALGAGSNDIVRQLLTESALLGISGGILGFALAQALLGLLLRFAPAGLPRLDMVRMAPAPFLVAAVVTVVTILLFGLLPAIGMTRSDLFSHLRADKRAGSEGRRLRGVRRILVASQLALALVLLAGAGLLARSFARLATLDMGYGTGHLAVLSLAMPWDKWLASCGPTPSPTDDAGGKRYMNCFNSQLYGFHDQVMDALRGIPGVTKASTVSVPPLLGSNVFMTQLMADGQSEAEIAANPWVGHDFVGPEYFETMGLPILRGRGFTGADREGAPNVGLVSETIARRFWPGQDPLGKVIRQVPTAVPITVVGLIPDIHFREHRYVTPMVIRPYRQGVAQGHFVFRTARDFAAISPSIRNAILTVDPDAVVEQARSMDEVIAPELAQPRLNALLLSAFAFVAVLLAAIGLYGIMAQGVAQQTRELGVRLALGATPSRLRSMILRQAFAVAGAGALAGLLGALAGSRLLTTMLFEVSPTDPVTLVGVSLLLLAVAILAAYLPARRVTRIDPARALRAE